MAVKGGLLIVEIISNADPATRKAVIRDCSKAYEDSGFTLISDDIGDPDLMIINEGATVENGVYKDSHPKAGVPKLMGDVILVFQRK
ncbi:MAG TPA: hypothetical protein VG942_15440 [Hyphomonadaceae bacterium]|nr:hypothetical protein [Hyphomonadaceae bacterium]